MGMFGATTTFSILHFKVIGTTTKLFGITKLRPY